MDCSNCASTDARVQQAAVQTQIQTAVAAKFLNAQRQQGAAVAALLEGAVEMSKEAGKGERLDAQA